MSSSGYGKIFNRSNGMTLSPYGAGVWRAHAITLFGAGWEVGYYKDWEFIPTNDGRFYTIKLVGFLVAMARANNPLPADGTWALYGNPVAMTEDYVAGATAQEWIIEYVDEHDADTHVVTIHPREAPDEVLAVGEDGHWPHPWCSTKLRTKLLGAQQTRNRQWLVPAGVVPVGRFSVSPADLVHLKRTGEPGYPGVKVQAVGDGPVPPQRIVVTLPQGRGLRFPSNRLLVGVMQGSQWKEMGYPGTLTAGGQTLIVEGVDLALSGKDGISSVLVEVSAFTNALAGDTSLSVQVGDQTSASSPIQVT